ncbi:MAG: HAMP domain-containing sensor histidine kinase [Bacteroides sp.]|jgi:signal transduction histidine kinase|nr:HAMP domain-containing sensor histidine kinase [Bacteroides sp.]
MFHASLRYQPEKIKAQGDKILKSPFFSQLLEDVPVVLLIINDARQVVYVNKDLLAGLSSDGRKELLGLRPGECLECIHATEGNFGCGSTAYCRVCGLANTIELSEDGRSGQGECSISLKDGESLTLKVHSKPFQYGKANFVFVALEDISDRKARMMLENIFLHDLRNTSAILSGLQEVFEDLDAEETKKILKDVAVRIDEEIRTYHLISSAENQQLDTHPMVINLPDMVQEVISSLLLNQKFNRKQVEYDGERQIIRTDKTLLRQVLVNMIKNGMEAGPANDTISIGHRFDASAKKIIIEVKNRQVMPREVQLKVFQKSFSTKGQGRGWGTYSIKLLTEKYLHGEASFVSTDATGTIFSIQLPESLNGRRLE